MNWRWCVGLIFCCGIHLGWAASTNSITPELNLLTINAIKTMEAQGDELYLDVTVFPAEGSSRTYQVPEHPQYWSSQQVDELNNVRIWQEALAEGEGVTLIISLMEQDGLWGTDDLIGSIRVRLRNHDGQLESSWSVPNRADVPTSILTQKGRAEKFQLLGDNSNYEVYLLLNAKGVKLKK